MARGVNKVILLGNLGQDPDVKYSAQGAAIATISIATSETWKDKQTGEQQQKTEWHRVVLFNRLAEIAGEYLRKGSKVYIEGKLQTRKWTDQQGVERYTTEIVGGEMQMLDSGGQASSNDGGQQYAPPQQPAPQQRSAPQGQPRPQARPSAPPPPPNMDAFDDDIPF